jgi:adenosylcobinamide-GDP ribazoletransferase
MDLLNSLRSLRAALAFYTLLPMGGGTLEFRAIARWLPLVGALLGSMLVLVHGLSRQIFPDVIAAGLTVIAWAALTGGLHLDGWIDVWDGLAIRDPERRFEAMSESTTGAYGVIGAVLLLVMKVLGVSALAHPADPSALFLAPVLGRWGQVIAIGLYPYAKAEGKGAFHRRSMKPKDYGVSVGLLLLVLFPTLYFWGWQTLVLIGGGVAGAWILSWFFARAFDGQTGDTYGAVVEGTEVLVLLLGTVTWFMRL